MFDRLSEGFWDDYRIIDYQLNLIFKDIVFVGLRVVL